MIGRIITKPRQRRVMIGEYDVSPPRRNGNPKILECILAAIDGGRGRGQRVVELHDSPAFGARAPGYFSGAGEDLESGRFDPSQVAILRTGSWPVSASVQSVKRLVETMSRFENLTVEATAMDFIISKYKYGVESE